MPGDGAIQMRWIKSGGEFTYMTEYEAFCSRVPSNSCYLDLLRVGYVCIRWSIVTRTNAVRYKGGLDCAARWHTDASLGLTPVQEQLFPAPRRATPPIPDCP